jgi:hypothetical protein
VPGEIKETKDNFAQKMGQNHLQLLRVQKSIAYREALIDLESSLTFSRDKVKRSKDSKR